MPPSAPERAYVGIGSNLGDPLATVRQAVVDLARLPHTRFVAASSLYRTTPVGYAEQPDFINAVVALDTTLSPQALLLALQAVEQAHGRQRSFKNAPRTLDLDLLRYGDRVISTPTLTLPHPRMQTRAFVLIPLAELGGAAPGGFAAEEGKAAAAGVRRIAPPPSIS